MFLQGYGLEEYKANPKSDEEELECFGGELSFGTAGLRAEMDVGFNRMNEVTVRIATMVTYLINNILKSSFSFLL